jgi:hypothetical protein
MLALKCFPDYDDKQGLVENLPKLEALGFTDSSWAQDSCPNVSGGDYRIWLDYANPELRESGASSRFLIERFDNELDEYVARLDSCDDWASLLELVDKLNREG